MRSIWKGKRTKKPPNATPLPELTPSKLVGFIPKKQKTFGRNENNFNNITDFFLHFDNYIYFLPTTGRCLRNSLPLRLGCSFNFPPLNKSWPTSSLGNHYAVQTFLALTTVEGPHLEAFPADRKSFFQILNFSLSTCPPPLPPWRGWMAAASSRNQSDIFLSVAGKQACTPSSFCFFSFYVTVPRPMSQAKARFSQTAPEANSGWGGWFRSLWFSPPRPAMLSAKASFSRTGSEVDKFSSVLLCVVWWVFLGIEQGRITKADGAFC